MFLLFHGPIDLHTQHTDAKGTEGGVGSPQRHPERSTSRLSAESLRRVMSYFNLRNKVYKTQRTVRDRRKVNTLGN